MRRAAAMLIIAAASLVAPLPAAAETLVVTLSTAEVKISSNFTGTGVTLFGAVERDAATVSRIDSYDVAVVVRGPPQDVTTRRKLPLFGIWINRDAQSFRNVPAFYSVHTSRELTEIGSPAGLERYQIGLDEITTAPAGQATGARPAAFKQAFLRLKERAGLYGEQIGTVEFHGESIFQTTIRLPANVPVGLYTATVYLFQGGALLARADDSFTISTTGFERFMSSFSREQGLLYGGACIVLALFTGWLAGVIFRRD